MSAEALKAKLKTGAVGLCRCWAVTKRDGEVLGFTDHDRDLSFDGVVYEAGAGLDAGAVERSTGLSVDNGQALGALRSDKIREQDLLAGRFDGAEVRQWLVDWAEPEDRLELFRGSLGEIRSGSGQFEAELRGLGEALNQPIGRSFLKTCDRDLGDTKCGVDLGDPAFSTDGVVSGVEGRQALSFVPSDDYAQRWFEGGALTWTTGANAGLSARVREDLIDDGTRRVTLWTEAPAGIAEGDGFRLVAGCDKHAETCRAKFDNILNFRGFPHMPGDDWVTAYPRSGDEKGETSRYWAEVRHE